MAIAFVTPLSFESVNEVTEKTRDSLSSSQFRVEVFLISGLESKSS